MSLEPGFSTKEVRWDLTVTLTSRRADPTLTDFSMRREAVMFNQVGQSVRQSLRRNARLTRNVTNKTFHLHCSSTLQCLSYNNQPTAQTIHHFVNESSSSSGSLLPTKSFFRFLFINPSFEMKRRMNSPVCFSLIFS